MISCVAARCVGDDYCSASGGHDWPESTVEALYQAAAGFGYNQGCHTSFETNFSSADDVPPFIAQPGDAFNGAVSGEYDPSVPGTGNLGGNGYREGAVPILVYTTDADVRNGFPPYNQGPKGSATVTAGCSPDATPLFLDAALDDINAKAIGVAARTSDALGAMNAIADMTGSYFDHNGNGQPDAGERMVYSSNSYDIVDRVLDGIEEFTTNVTYDMTIEAEVPSGTLLNVDPPSYSDIPALNVVTFTLTLEPEATTDLTMFSDTVWVIPTTLYGNGQVVLREWDLIFVVTND